MSEPTVRRLNIIESLTTSPTATVNLQSSSTGSAYTQTYSTGSKTVANATFVAPVGTATTQTTPYGFATQAQGDAVVVGLIALAADVLQIKKNVTSIIDDLQAQGLVL